MRAARGWLPTRLSPDRQILELADLAGHSLAEPFLSQSIEGARLSPTGLASAWVPADELEPWSTAVGPAGFLLHTARCGSTLLSHLLQAAGCNVINESMVVSDLLVAEQGLDPACSPSAAARLLPVVVAQFGGDVQDPVRPLVVKLTGWDSGRCAALLRRWPSVPVIGVTREPVGVITSQLQRAPDYRDRLFETDEVLRAWFDRLPVQGPYNALQLYAAVWAVAVDALLDLGRRAVVFDYDDLRAAPYEVLQMTLEHLAVPGTCVPPRSAVAALAGVDAWDHRRAKAWAPSTRAPTSARTRGRVLEAVGIDRERARIRAVRRPGPGLSNDVPSPSPSVGGGSDVRLTGPLEVTLLPRPELLEAYRLLADVPPGPAALVTDRLVDGFGDEARGLGARGVTEAEHLAALGAVAIAVHDDVGDEVADVPRPVGRATELYRLVAAEGGGEPAFLRGEELARAVGYPLEELHRADDDATGMVGLGNPFALGAIPAGARVLDVGCGAGTDLRLAARRVGMDGIAVGLDRVGDMLGVADRAARATGTPLALVQGDVDALPLAGASFDFVVANGVLAMARDKASTLAEIARVLRPGGWLHLADQLWEGTGGSDAVQCWNAALVGAPMRARWEDLICGVGFDEVEWSAPVRPFAPTFGAGDLTVRTVRARRVGTPAQSLPPLPPAHPARLFSPGPDPDADRPDLDRVLVHHPNASIAHVGGEALLWGPPWRSPGLLSPTATLLWRATETPVTVGDVVADLEDVFGLPPLVAQAQSLAFARELGCSGHLVGADPLPPAAELPYLSPLVGLHPPGRGPLVISPLVADRDQVVTEVGGGRALACVPRWSATEDGCFTAPSDNSDHLGLRLAVVEDGADVLLLSDLGVPLWRGTDHHAALEALATAAAALERRAAHVSFRLHALLLDEGVVLLQPEFAFAWFDGPPPVPGVRLAPVDVAGVDADLQAHVAGDIQPIRAVVFARAPGSEGAWTRGTWAWALALAAVAVDVGCPLDQEQVIAVVLGLLGQVPTVAATGFRRDALAEALSALPPG